MKRTTSGFSRNRKRPMQDISSTIFFSFNQVLHCLHIKFPNFLRFLSFSFCSSSFCSLDFVRVNFFGLAVSTLLRKTCFIAQTSLTGYPLKQSPSCHLFIVIPRIFLILPFAVVWSCMVFLSTIWAILSCPAFSGKLLKA